MLGSKKIETKGKLTLADGVLTINERMSMLATMYKDKKGKFQEKTVRERLNARQRFKSFLRSRGSQEQTSSLPQLKLIYRATQFHQEWRAGAALQLACIRREIGRYRRSAVGPGMLSKAVKRCSTARRSVCTRFV